MIWLPLTVYIFVYLFIHNNRQKLMSSQVQNSEVQDLIPCYFTGECGLPSYLFNLYPSRLD